MSLDIFLSEVVVLLASAVVVMLVSVRLHVPPIVALLATGVLIGPHGLGWISSVREVELFAEVGVALLLFTIGLEVSIDRLRKLRRALLLGGSVQVSLTTVVVTGVAAVGLGLPWLHALFIGWVVSLSSTALVLKLLSDRRETETPHGQLALAILLFQDFLIVPMIVLTPFLAGTLGFSIGAFLGRLAGAVAALAVVFLIGRRLLPRLLEVVVRSGAREVLPLGALALCLGIGWLTHSFGFSLAIGSFLAGVLLAGSLYSHQVIADIAPFRDLFSSIFFISIGMLLDVGWVAARPGTVIAVAAGMIALKIVTAGAAVAVLGYPVRTVVLSALALAQVGEFSFVLMEVGLENGLLIGGRFQLLLAAAVVTLLATPVVVTVSHRLSAWLGGLVPSRRATATQQPTEGEESDHVIIVGFGVGGRLLARVLREGGIPYIVVELSGELVRSGRREDEPMLYGDTTREEILRRAGIERANVVAFAISDIAAVLLGVRLARRLAPGAQIIVRTRLVSEIEGLRAAGADQVVAEEFETAIEVFTRVLERYHVPRNIVRAQTRVLRGEGYRMLRSSSLDRTVSQAVLDALAAGTTDVYLLNSDTVVRGRSLRELDLRQRTGATVIAVVRDGLSQLNPEPDLSLEPGDSLVLVGSHQEIDGAFDLLASFEEDLERPE